MTKIKYKKIKYYVLAFLTTALLMTTLFVINGVAPFGSKVFSCYDAGGQYISYFSYYKKLINGTQSLFYTFKKTLGGNGMGLFAYYLASPLNLVFAFSSEQNVPQTFNLLILIKISLSSTAMAAYFFEKEEKIQLRNLIFTTAYGLCGYNIAYGWNVMWLDSVIALPIVALGLKKIGGGGSPLTYILSLAYSIISCFYTGYMLCIFSLIYYLYLYFSNDTGCIKKKKTIQVYVLSSLSAGGISAAIILPAIMSLSGGKSKSFMDIASYYTYTISLRILEILVPDRQADYDSLVKYILLGIIFLVALVVFSYVTFFVKHKSKKARMIATAILLLAVFVFYLAVESHTQKNIYFLLKSVIGNVEGSEIYEGSPNVFCGILVFILFVSYFFNGEIPIEKRFCSFTLCAVIIISFAFYLPNTIWHGFTENNNFNFRYSFVLSFLMVDYAKQAADLVSRKSISSLIAGGLAALAGCIEGVIYKPYFVETFQPLPEIILTVILVIFLVLYSLFRYRTIFAVLGILQTLNIIYSANITISHQLTMAEYDAEMYISNLQLGNDVFDEIEDEGAYRCRKDHAFINVNDPMVFLYNGISHFSSTERNDTIDFMSGIGAPKYFNVYINGDTGTSTLTRAEDTLLGIKYLISDDEYTDYDGQGILKTNPYALPLIFYKECSFDNSAFILGDESIENINNAYKNLTGISIYSKALAERDSTESSNLYKLTITEENPLYVELNYGYAIKCYKNSEVIKEFPVRILPDAIYGGNWTYDGCVKYLGTFKPGEEITLEIKSNNEDLNIKFYYEDSTKLKDAVEKLTKTKITIDALSDAHIKFTLQPECDGEIITTIPYDKGWHIKIDGKEVRSQKALGFFVSAYVDKGKHQAELYFVPQGLIAGITITFVSLVLIALINKNCKQNVRKGNCRSSNCMMSATSN